MLLKNFKKSVSIFLICFLLLGFICFDYFFNNNSEDIVLEVISPVEFKLQSGNIYKVDGLETFDFDYTEKNKILAQKLKLSEDEAFIMGNLAKYWAKNLVENRKISFGNNNMIYYKFDYKTRLENSSFGIKDFHPTNTKAFERQLNSIRKGKFVIHDIDSDISYPISKENRGKVKIFVVVRKNHVKNVLPKITTVPKLSTKFSTTFQSGNIKIILSDLTSKIVPDRNCSSDICKEILKNINSTQNTIDMAIYGYSSTPAIESALTKAKQRGVKIRLVYDIDAKGNNIYPDTNKFLNFVSESINDGKSSEVKNTMHDKFYIFDDKTVITGSANLSHTDMSGYNSNSIIVINSSEVAKFYKQEFEQMFNGKFHNDKVSTPNKFTRNIKVYFSPQDKAITNGILPLIKNAKEYIYIPAFVITEKRINAELINAKNRGVDVKIIVDALNASTQHSKHKELRSAGIQVKAENYAGKMHSKTVIIDDKYLVIGSMNFSNSGENRNDENLVIIENSDASKFYKDFFIYQWAKIPDKWLKYTPRAEGKDSIGSCLDGLDNNYDGYTDMEDSGCNK